MTHSKAQSLALLGCGRMGAALLQGWLKQGHAPETISVFDPHPASWLGQAGVKVNAPLPAAPDVLVLAVKPQLMAEALPQILTAPGTLVISVAAGLPLAWFEARLGAEMPIIRAMPNTPAAIGAGITAIIGNVPARTKLDLAAGLLEAVGKVVRLESEAQMDAVTAVSGSGPAYVFHMIETLTEAGIAEGLHPDLALDLARQTIAGAGALAVQSASAPAELRENVTSPNGTTAAGLAELMHPQTGLAPLMRRTVAAARRRSEELANG